MSAFAPGARRPILPPKPSALAPPSVASRSVSSVVSQRRIEALDPGGERRQTHRLEHVLVVGAVGAVGADADGHAGLEHPAHARDAVAEPHVAAGVVGDGGTAITQPLDLVVVEPHDVRAGEVGADEAERVEMGDQRFAVAPEARELLHLRLGHVHVDADAVLAGEVATALHERVAAVQRNRGAERETDRVALVLPRVERVPHGGEARLPRRELHALDLRASVGRQRVEQAGDRRPERAIRHHGRDHRTHPDFRIRPGHGVQPFERRRRELVEQVVARRAAFRHHLGGDDQRREIPVFEGASTRQPWTGVEEQLQRPPVARAAAEPAVAVRVRVDQSGHQQLAAGVDHPDVGRRCRSGRDDRGDRVPVLVKNSVRPPPAELDRRH
jgi:hypothetical protein